MEIIYWSLGYISCGLLFIFLAPLCVWVIGKYDDVESEIFLERSTYTTKWNYAYSDLSKIAIILCWPIFVLLFIIFWCKNLPKMINYIFYEKRQRYIASVNEKAALIMKE